MAKFNFILSTTSTSTNSSHGLLQRNHTRRQLRNHSFQNRRVNSRRIRRALDRVIADNKDLVVQIKQPIRRAQHHTTRPDPRNHNRVDSLRAQDLLQSISSTSIIPRLLQDSGAGRVERGVDLCNGRSGGLVLEGAAGAEKGSLGCEFGVAGEEVDAGEDCEGWGGEGCDGFGPG